jgi:DNA damage-binding protein 2
MSRSLRERALRVVQHADDDDVEDEEDEEEEEEESSEEDDDDDEEVEDAAPRAARRVAAAAPAPAAAPAAAPARAKPIKISLSAAKAAAALAGGCKVCGARDHTAGFQGSVYLDCPNKPCYLCKLVRPRARAARGAARGCGCVRTARARVSRR